MPSTTDYYNTLKTQLETAAANKKTALDLAYERATTAQFDAAGKMTRKKNADGTDKAPGTLDVAFDEQQRQLSGGAESSGMLKSGQFGRDLATSQAAYRTAVAGGLAETQAGKTQIENETATELAKYQAMYKPATPAKVAPAPKTPAGGTKTPAGGTPSAKPVFIPPGTSTAKKGPTVGPIVPKTPTKVTPKPTGPNYGRRK